MGLYRLLEDHGTVAVNQDAVLQVPADGAGKDTTLDLPAEADQVLYGVAVGNVGDILMDDRASVELLRYVGGGRPDRLHPPLVGPAVGVRAGEGREEGVVDVDDSARVGVDKLPREDLHVAGEHHEVHVLLVEEIQDPGLLLRLGLLRDRQMVERDAVVHHPGGEVRMVGDDKRYLRLELPRVPAPQEVYEAVVVAGDQDRHPFG